MIGGGAMSIEWLTKKQLEDRLRHDNPAPGLWLREFVSGRLPAGFDLRAAFDRAPEFDDWLPGLAVEDGWTGLADGVPFTLAGRPHPGDGRWGFYLALPVRVHDDGRLDVGWLLRVAASILPELRRFDKPWFQPLSFAGPGWGVFYGGYRDHALFQAPVRDDALAVVRFIGAAPPPDSYWLARTVPTGEELWTVCGPRIGGFISRVSDGIWSRERAEQRAAQWSAELGAPFTLRAAQAQRGDFPADFPADSAP